LPFLKSKRRFRLGLLVFAFLILVFVDLALIGEPALAQSKAISQAYQITHVDIATPSLSPDAKRMVFEQVIEGKEELFAMDLDGSNSVQLTHGPYGSAEGLGITVSYRASEATIRGWKAHSEH
jgi:hypothetical protein